MEGHVSLSTGHLFVCVLIILKEIDVNQLDRPKATPRRSSLLFWFHLLLVWEHLPSVTGTNESIELLTIWLLTIDLPRQIFRKQETVCCCLCHSTTVDLLNYKMQLNSFAADFIVTVCLLLKIGVYSSSWNYLLGLFSI